jgi:hypothetical protein
MASQEAGSITRDVVDASAFAPTRACAGEDFLVQIFLHTPSNARGADELAREADPDTVRRGVATLEVEVERGQRIGIVLDAPGLTIDEPSQSLIWRGEPRACQFVVTVPPEQAGRDCRIRARVLIGAIPVGALRFTLKVVEREATTPLELAGDAAQRYSRAFLSHSHEDRVKVLSHAQLLEAAGIKYFQDIASLRAMEHWESRLHQEIDGCDLFLLFWTGSAARSEWVERETRYALARQSTSSDGAPEIAPIFLEPVRRGRRIGCRGVDISTACCAWRCAARPRTPSASRTSRRPPQVYVRETAMNRLLGLSLALTFPCLMTGGALATDAILGRGATLRVEPSTGHPPVTSLKAGEDVEPGFGP